MKKLLLVAMIVNACLGIAMAQIDPDKRDDRLAAYRAEVYTRVLQLSAEEAQGFWPVYNDFLERRDQIQGEYKPGKQEDQMSDAEVEDLIKRHFEKKQRDLDLERDLYQKLRKVLPLRKIAKIPIAERDFRESLVKKLQENRQKRIQERRQNLGRG